MIVIPDVHGRDFWLKPVEAGMGKEHILFLGDYVDPYDSEGISDYQALRYFEFLLSLKRQNMNEMTLLLGNHDLHYVDRSLFSGRFNRENADRYRQLIRENADCFDMAAESTIGRKRFLFSHAGIMFGWIVYNKNILNVSKTDEICRVLNEMWHNPTLRPDLMKVLAQVSESRWGSYPFGSPVWSDVDDMTLARPEISNYYQVFGHTQQDKPVINKFFACLDCRTAFRIDSKGVIRKI